MFNDQARAVYVPYALTSSNKTLADASLESIVKSRRNTKDAISLWLMLFLVSGLHHISYLVNLKEGGLPSCRAVIQLSWIIESSYSGLK
jgi:hypothetical protein